MSVAVLTEFPQSVVAGDTLRVEISNADYPSNAWTLQVQFDGPTRATFNAGIGDGDGFELVAPSAGTAALTPGGYAITFVFTETSSGERKSVPSGEIQVLQNPTGALVKSNARLILEAMESALVKLSAGSNISVSFNGQSFTKKNIKDLQDAISRQKGIVASEANAGDLAAGISRSTGIGIRFA